MGIAQRSVEVVGHTRRQGAERRQPLPLDQLLLGELNWRTARIWPKVPATSSAKVTLPKSATDGCNPERPACAVPTCNKPTRATGTRPWAARHLRTAPGRIAGACEAGQDKLLR